MDKVVHFELPTDDFARASKFYSETFGWQLMDMPEMNYVMANTVDVDQATHIPKEPGAINGGFMKRNAIITSPTFAINVADVDAATAKIKAAGGTIIKERTAVGDMGFIVYFKDTEGNLLSVWQNAH